MPSPRSCRPHDQSSYDQLTQRVQELWEKLVQQETQSTAYKLLMRPAPFDGTQTDIATREIETRLNVIEEFVVGFGIDIIIE